MLLVRTAIAALGENPVITMPRAVLLAGGCSTSRATISKIEGPTASEYTMMEGKREGWEIRAHAEPEKRPTM